MKFYILRSPKLEDGQEPRLAVTDFVESEPFNVGNSLKCPLCGNPVSMRLWLPPYRAELEFWGKEAGDIAFFGDSILISDRFKRLWEQAGLIGLSGFYHIEIMKMKSFGRKKGIKPSGGYYYVEIARSRTSVDDEASELFRPKGRYCEECGGGDPEWAKRIIIKENTWSGEDIFYARDFHGRIITSERYLDFHLKNQINNGILVEASLYDFNWSLGKGYKPG